MRFPQQKPMFPLLPKFIFDFSFDSFHPITYRHLVNKKDGFNGSLQIGDTLFPECADLGLGDVVTAENIAELTMIFTNESLVTAVADSVATAQLVTVTLPSLDAIDAAVGFLQRNYVDVDYDRIGCSVTIFGDDQRIEGDEDEGHWVLNLVIPQTPFIDTNAI